MTIYLKLTKIITIISVLTLPFASNVTGAETRLFSIGSGELSGGYFATARAIRETDNGATVPILALSAGTVQDNLERCLDAGMNDFVEAPVASPLLIRTVNQWVSGERFSMPPTDERRTVNFTGIAEESAAARLIPGSADLDTAKTLDRLGGDKALYVRLLSRFKHSHETSLTSLRHALEERNLQSAMLFAHTLASTAANIGASALYETAKVLEMRLHKDDAIGAFECLIDLEMAASRAVLAVEKYLTDETGAGEVKPAAVADDWQVTANRLRQHIEANDSAALDLLNELRQALGPKVSTGPLFLRLETCVTAYDFETARTHLDALLQWVRENPVVPALTD